MFCRMILCLLFVSVVVVDVDACTPLTCMWECPLSCSTNNPCPAEKACSISDNCQGYVCTDPCFARNATLCDITTGFGACPGWQSKTNPSYCKAMNTCTGTSCSCIKTCYNPTNGTRILVVTMLLNIGTAVSTPSVNTVGQVLAIAAFNSMPLGSYLIATLADIKQHTDNIYLFDVKVGIKGAYPEERSRYLQQFLLQLQNGGSSTSTVKTFSAGGTMTTSTITNANITLVSTQDDQFITQQTCMDGTIIPATDICPQTMNSPTLLVVPNQSSSSSSSSSINHLAIIIPAIVGSIIFTQRDMQQQA